jgi:hypothetical protein
MHIFSLAAPYEQPGMPRNAIKIGQNPSAGKVKIHLPETVLLPVLRNHWTSFILYSWMITRSSKPQ